MANSAADFLVVGGGIAGLSVAYWLLQHDSRARITVISPDSEAHLAASQLNAGLLTVGSFDFFAQNRLAYGSKQATEILEFCQHNHELLARQAFFKPLRSYERLGSLSFTDLQTEPVKFFETADPPQAFSKLSNLKCLRYRGDGSIDPKELVSALRASLRVNWMYELAESIDTKTKTVKTQTGKVAFHQLFIATNAWTQDFIGASSIRPVRAQALKTTPVDFRIKGNIYISSDKVYLRQNQNNQLIVGGLRSVDSASEETNKFGRNQKIQTALLQFLQTYFDSQIAVAKQWSGIMAFTDDHLPIVGPVNSFAHVLGGFSGHGMGMAFHCAKRLVENALEKTPLPGWMIRPDNKKKL